MLSHCNSCFINKTHKLPFGNTSLSSTRPLELLFSDVWTSPLHSFDGFKYYLILVDHFTRYTWYYPLKHKYHVATTFKQFKILTETKFNTKIVTFFSDNGGEFIALSSFFAANGITHLTTPPHTPQHNGIAERRHRHIVETGLSLLTHSSIPTSYWSFAFAAAVYLINRMPNSAVNFQIPYQLLFQEFPNYHKLRTFGCLCYPWLRPYAAHKLSPRSLPCVFLGYSLTQSAYLCLEPVSKRLYTSRHVQFIETAFPFAPKSPNATVPPTSPPTADNSSSLHPPVTRLPSPFTRTAIPASATDPSPSSSAPPLASEHQASLLSSPANGDPEFAARLALGSAAATRHSPHHAATRLPDHSPLASPSDPPSAPLSAPMVSSTTVPVSAAPAPLLAPAVPASAAAAPSAPLSPAPVPPVPPSPIRRSLSSADDSTQFLSLMPENNVDTFCHVSPSNSSSAPNNHPMLTRLKDNITKPNKRYCLVSSLSSQEMEPATTTQALSDPNWRQAMCDELDAQFRNQTWTLVPPNPRFNLVGCSWVFRLKRIPDGSLLR